MSEQQRMRDPGDDRPAVPGGATPANLNAIQNAAARLLAAADQAISQALSGDSEAFLRANRQEGGQ